MQIASNAATFSSISQFLTGNIQTTPVPQINPVAPVKSNAQLAAAQAATAQRSGPPTPNTPRGSYLNVVV